MEVSREDGRGRGVQEHKQAPASYKMLVNSDKSSFSRDLGDHPQLDPEPEKHSKGSTLHTNDVLPQPVSCLSTGRSKRDLC